MGDALVEAITRWTRSQGPVRLVLAVRQANLHAVALYERQGLRDVGWASAADEPFPEPRMMLTVLRPETTAQCPCPQASEMAGAAVPRSPGSCPHFIPAPAGAHCEGPWGCAELSETTAQTSTARTHSLGTGQG